MVEKEPKFSKKIEPLKKLLKNPQKILRYRSRRLFEKYAMFMVLEQDFRNIGFEIFFFNPKNCRMSLGVHGSFRRNKSDSNF